MNCWKCGATIETGPGQRIASRDACPQCGEAVHACRNCRFYEPSKNNQCAEPQAEWVRDKERANYCDYFQPSSHPASRPASSRPVEDARKKFNALFRS